MMFVGAALRGAPRDNTRRTKLLDEGWPRSATPTPADQRV